LNIGLGGVIVTAPGDGGEDYVCRFFAPSVGIDEDPVTGSISCMLAPYWSERLGKRRLTARQLSPRGGSMDCEVVGARVMIAGPCRLYSQGVLHV
jgi:predicted PhzF superfamily epimerase YddE/YHI9